MDASARAWQKQEDAIVVFWDRRLSPFFTRNFVKAGITPNQATLLWGAISIANSYAVYRALTGDYWLVPIVWAIYILCSVIDCADGEIARATNNVNPVAGKLLDGICHRATEYSLLGVFGAAAWTLTGSAWALPVTILLPTGDAMQSYVYERRLSILRVQQRVVGHLRQSPEGLYAWGTPWRALSPRQRIATITGSFHYKSIYPVIALGYLSGQLLLIGLTALGVYKHWKWLQLMASTLSGARQPNSAAAEAESPVTTPDLAAAAYETIPGGRVNGR